MTRTLFTAIKIALFVWFLAIMTSLVGLGSKILNVPAPTMPTVPAFSFEIEAGGEYTNSHVEAGGSFAFDFGGTQTASQTGKTSLNSFTTPQAAQTNLGRNTVNKTRLTANTASGRVSFNPKGNQLPGGR